MGELKRPRLSKIAGCKSSELSDKRRRHVDRFKNSNSILLKPVQYGDGLTLAATANNYVSLWKKEYPGGDHGLFFHEIVSPPPGCHSSGIPRFHLTLRKHHTLDAPKDIRQQVSRGNELADRFTRGHDDNNTVSYCVVTAFSL